MIKMFSCQNHLYRFAWVKQIDKDEAQLFKSFAGRATLFFLAVRLQTYFFLFSSTDNICLSVHQFEATDDLF